MARTFDIGVIKVTSKADVSEILKKFKQVETAAANVEKKVNGLNLQKLKELDQLEFKNLQNLQMNSVTQALQRMEQSLSGLTRDLDAIKSKIIEVNKAAANTGQSGKQQTSKFADLTTWDATKTKMLNTIDTIEKKIYELSATSQESMYGLQYWFTQVGAAQKEFADAVNDPVKADEAYKRYQVALQACNSELKKYTSNVKDSNKEIKLMTNASTLSNKMQKWLQDGGMAASQYALKIRDLCKELESPNLTSTRYEQISAEFKRIQSEAGLMGNAVLSAFQKMVKGSTLGTLALTAIGRGVMMLRTQIRELIQDSVEIESALAQLQIVTGVGGSQLDQFFGNAAESAKQFGVEVKDMLGSVETFSRLGYDLQEALDFSEAATMLSNVANTTVDTATTGLTSIMKGFGLGSDDAEHIADVITKIGQAYAISADEIMEAMTKSASAFNATGTSFEKSVALLAAGNASINLCRAA